MKAFLLTIVSACVFSTAFSQRYEQHVIDKIKRTTATYLTTDAEDLQMDIYQPVGDPEKARPVLIYVHGGGFSGGKRDEPMIIDFCEDMTRRGLVVVSMSYTLTMQGQSFGCDQPAENKLATFKQAGIEVGEAVAYLLKHKESLRIDPQNIILSGSSAGAEAVLHAAYWSDTHTALPDNFSYAGVISMAGAIFDINLINPDSAIPTQLFHGTCDNLVPYSTAAHHYCKEGDEGYMILYGGKTIADRLGSINRGYYLVTSCNGGHEWASFPMKEYKSEIADFILQDVINGKKRQIHEITVSENECRLTSAEKFDICSQ